MILSAVTTELNALQRLMASNLSPQTQGKSGQADFSGSLGGRSYGFGSNTDTFQRSGQGSVTRAMDTCEQGHDFPPLLSF